MGKLFYNSRVFRQDDFYYADDDPHHIRSVSWIQWCGSGSDPYFSGPPRSGSISTRYGSGSGSSIIKQK
jgi:hypothetical protein